MNGLCIQYFEVEKVMSQKYNLTLFFLVVAYQIFFSQSKWWNNFFEILYLLWMSSLFFDATRFILDIEIIDHVLPKIRLISCRNLLIETLMLSFLWHVSCCIFAGFRWLYGYVSWSKCEVLFVLAKSDNINKFKFALSNNTNFLIILLGGRKLTDSTTWSTSY